MSLDSKPMAEALVREYDRRLPCGRTVFDLIKDDPRALEISRLFFKAGYQSAVNKCIGVIEQEQAA